AHAGRTTKENAFKKTFSTLYNKTNIGDKGNGVGFLMIIFLQNKRPVHLAPASQYGLKVRYRDATML
ncbi:hypothetical protein, partial [Xylanibacillus composti]|uniref:hypothetical protein n=1 Tax=Xylanibacillus composti TaxID=1572762 RepID=UPI001BCE0638